MTAMCVLSKISGLRDKIRITELHDAIVKGKAEKSRSTAGAKERVEQPAVSFDRNNDNVLKFDTSYPYAHRGLPGENDLTIKVGLAKTGTGEMQMCNVQEKGEGSEINRVNARSRQRSTGAIELQTNDIQHRNRQVLVSVIPAPKRDPNRTTVGRGISPAPQHWESMIAKCPPRDEIGMTRNDDPEDGESVFNSKSSQFPSKEVFARGSHNATVVTNKDIGSFDYDGEYADKDKNNSFRQRSNKVESEPMPPTPAGTGKRGGFKRIALEFLDIFGGVKRNTSHGRSRTITRTKTLYKRIPPDSNRNINDRRRVKIIYRSA